MNLRNYYSSTYHRAIGFSYYKSNEYRGRIITIHLWFNDIEVGFRRQPYMN